MLPDSEAGRMACLAHALPRPAMQAHSAAFRSPDAQRRRNESDFATRNFHSDP